MNKNVKKSSNGFSVEGRESVMESKVKAKKDVIRTNQMYNKVLKDFDVEDLETLEVDELELLEHKVKSRR